MRLVLRKPAPAAQAVPHAPFAGAGRRAWIEALFGDHLPRDPARRERAIDALAGDGSVWHLLHQARHSMAETTATIERLARAALATEPLRAA